MRAVIPLCGLLAAASLGLQAGLAQAPAEIGLKRVKYDGLVDLVRQNKGKVIVIDFWADY